MIDFALQKYYMQSSNELQILSIAIHLVQLALRNMP